MARQDLIINGVLLAAILGVAYLFASYEIERKKSGGLEAQLLQDENAVPSESHTVRPAITPVDRALISQINPFRTIITPTPTPTPTPPPTPTPLPINLVLGQYQLVMLDPPRSVTLLDPKTQQQFEWLAGQTRRISLGAQTLDVTLQSVDPNEFKAIFVAPNNQTFPWGFFGAGK